MLFETQVQWISQSALALIYGNPSKISNRFLRYDLPLQKLCWLPLIDRSIDLSVYKIIGTLVERGLWRSLVQPPMQSRAVADSKSDQLSHFLTKSWKPPRVEFLSPPQLQVPELPVWASWAATWEPLLLPFITVLCSTLYRCQEEFSSIIYCSSSSSLSLGTLHPWRHSKLEQTALQLTLFWAGVGGGVSRGPFQPKFFHDFAVRLDFNSRFLLKGH